jgi:hypothetical protein
MIGVAECLSDDGPGLIVWKALNVQQDSQKLDGGDGGMSVVELNLVKLRELIPICVVQLEALNDILDSSTAEEVLLLEA